MTELFEVDTQDYGFFKAHTDMRLKQFYIVTLYDDDEIAICNATDTPLGVLQNKPNIGQVAKVRMHGISRVVTANGLTALAQFGSNASGQAIPITADHGIYLGECIVTGTGALGVASVSVEGGIKHTLSV